MLNIHDHVESGLTPLIKRVSEAAFTRLKLNDADSFNVIVIDDKKMQEINQTFAGHDHTTDVLSFPSGLSGEIGDVFISLDKAQAQAEELGHSLEREIGFLTVHGLLHCIGYTHENEDALATMTTLQETILDDVDLKRAP